MGAFATGMKYTALGCLGLVLIASLAIGTLGFVAVKQADASPIEDESREWDPGLDLGSPTELREVAGEGLPALAPDPAPGVIVLDLSSGGFEIEPAAPGEGLSIDGKYRKSNHELTEEFVEGDGDEPWRYTVTFRQTRRTMITAVQSMLGKNKAELTIRVPPDMPYRLELILDSGGMEAELGGLWLTDLDLDISKGGGAITFDEPLRQPLDSMQIDCRMGGLAMAGVINAAPHELGISVRMGGMDIRLDGDWPHDTMVSVFTKRGGVEIGMPDNVRVEGVPEGLYRSRVPDSPEIPAPVFRFSSDSTFENVEFN